MIPKTFMMLLAKAMRQFSYGAPCVHQESKKIVKSPKEKKILDGPLLQSKLTARFKQAVIILNLALTVFFSCAKQTLGLEGFTRQFTQISPAFNYNGR